MRDCIALNALPAWMGPKLSEEESKTLDKEITKQETAHAIGSMQA